jgi:hypothetical protein
MRQVSAALRAAIDAGERVIKSELTVDWDKDGIQDIDVLTHKVGTLGMTQSLENSLPQQVQVVPGVAVAELNARFDRGNTVRYTIPTSYRSVTSAQSNLASSMLIARPATAVPGNVLVLAFFIPESADKPGSMLNFDVNRDMNALWTLLATRGDGVEFSLPGYARVEGLLLQRRVTTTDPDAYTLTFPLGVTMPYLAILADIGDAGLMGITDYTTKGSDSAVTFTTVSTPPVNVDVPNSTIITFFAATSTAVTGSAFSTYDPGDTERVEIFTSSPLVSGYANARAMMMSTDNVPQGRYVKTVNYSGASAVAASVGFCVVLAPKLAGDEAQHAAWTFSELNANSPYAGKMRIRRPTKWTILFATSSGFESVPVFTGFTSTSAGESRGRTATMKALDNRETMRGPNRGVGVVAENPVSTADPAGRSFMPGLEATWMISYLFSHAFVVATSSPIADFNGNQPELSGKGYFVSPLAMRDSMVWAPMHGSAEPFIGTTVFAYRRPLSLVDGRLRFTPGPFLTALESSPSGVINAMGWRGSGASHAWSNATSQLAYRVQFWVKRVNSNSTFVFRIDDTAPVGTYLTFIEMNTTGLVQFNVFQPIIIRNVLGPTIPNDGAWHFLGVQVDSVAGNVRFRVDSTITDVAMTTWANTPTSPSISTDFVSMSTGNGTQFSELQVLGGYDFSGTTQRYFPRFSQPWANESFTPTAFIDRSSLMLDCIPFIDPQNDAWSVVSAIANSEFAAAFFDADGYPHYRTAASDVSTTGQTVQKQITSRRSIKDVSYESGVLQIANAVRVSWTQFVVIINQQAFSASGAIRVPTGSVINFDVTLPGPILGQPVVTLFTANIVPDGSGLDVTVLATATATSNANQPYGFTITVMNYAGLDIWLVDSAGSPALTVSASWFAPADGGDTGVAYQDLDSMRKFGEQPLPEISGSPWMQSEESAAFIALKLLSDLCDAHPTISNISIKGDPTLEFGDLVTVQDVFGLGVNGNYRITRKDPNHTPDGGFTQDLTVREASAVAYWDVNSWDDGTVWG